MKIRTVIVIAFLFFYGCVPVPKKTIPIIPRPEVYGTLSPATGWLDCISKELCHHNSRKVKVALSTIPNEFALKVSDLQLPSKMNAFIENSLDRINNGYSFYEGYEMLGVPGLHEDMFALSGHNEELVRTAVATKHINPDFIITGGLYMGQETKAAFSEIEILNLGLRGEVKAYDLSLQLKAVDSFSRQKVVLKSLTVRLYSAQQGGSAFFVTGGNDDFVSQGSVSGVQAPSVIVSLQYLSDYAVAALMRELSTAVYGLSFSMCDSEIVGQDKSKTPYQSDPEVNLSLFNVSVFKNTNGFICAKINKKPGAKVDPKDRLKVIWRQYASEISLNIPIGPTLYDHVYAETLRNTTVCLPINKTYFHSKAFELEVIHEDTGVTVGLGAF